MMVNLENAGNWDFLGKMFKRNGCTFERLTPKAIRSVYSDVYNNFVQNYGRKYTMGRVVERGRSFVNFSCARYATGVTFYISYRQSGRIEEGKKYFSLINKIYGLKVEVPVLSVDLPIMCSPHNSGSVSD